MEGQHMDLDDQTIFVDGVESDDSTNSRLDNQTDEAQECGNKRSRTSKKGHVKRKPMAKRSKAWNHFLEGKDADGNKIATCKYCSVVYQAKSSVNGTKNLNRHYKTCVKNPDNMGKEKQAKLVLEPIGEEGGTLKSWTFNQNDAREALGYMIILDELPFRFVEKPGFKHLMNVVCPEFRLPSRITIARDCYELYASQRLKLKKFLDTDCQRVCVTTDTWTSIQKINYMCLTAHFIDCEWKLQKRILNFCTIYSHKGDSIADAIENCLLDWGLSSKLFTITVDNASSNDVACSLVRTNMRKRDACVGNGKYIHMRCIAHILNLAVSDGLKLYEISVNRVRAAVKYIKQSPSRLKRFKECVESENIKCKASLRLDVCTRWNSTHIMLSTACKFESAFLKYSRKDPHFKIELERELGNTPQPSDWERVKCLSDFLEGFYDITRRISGSLYVTANTLFFDIVSIYEMLSKWEKTSDPKFVEMAQEMRTKCDKYWGNIDKMNSLIYVAAVLDPRVKLVGLEIALTDMFKDKEKVVQIVQSMIKKITQELETLFDEYWMKYKPSAPHSGLSGCVSTSEPTPDSVANGGNRVHRQIMGQIRKLSSGPGGGGLIKTELQRYLNEANLIVEDNEDFDILLWWKLHCPRFPVLSRLVRDVLAMPISTVASESAFSAGGRHLDQFRSTLDPKTVQALICAQDWFRMAGQEISIEESLKDLEELEKDLQNINLEDNVIDVVDPLNG